MCDCYSGIKSRNQDDKIFNNLTNRITSKISRNYARLKFCIFRFIRGLNKTNKMPWEPPIIKAKAYEEFCRKLEKLPDPLPQPKYDPPMTYFNNQKTYTSNVPYDLFYNFEEGFNPKSSRDDRKSLLPIMENIFKEEENKYIPVTTQLVYGRPLLLRNPVDTSGRLPKNCAIKDFYRSQGINITPELEKQPDH